MTSRTTNKFSPGVPERAVRMVLEHEAEHASRWTALSSISAKIGAPGEMAQRLKTLERENRELGKPTRSFARRRLILPGRSSTAGSSPDRLHRRSPRGLRGRADVQGPADRPWRPQEIARIRLRQRNTIRARHRSRSTRIGNVLGTERRWAQASEWRKHAKFARS